MHNHPELTVFNISLGHLSGWQQLSVLVGLILTFFIVQGFMVERITSAGFRYGWCSAFIEMILFSVFSIGETRWNGATTWLPTASNVPWKGYFVIAMALTMARGLTWVSLAQLSFPTALLIKSSKLVAVMLGGVIFLKKKYSRWDYSVAVAVMIGMGLFMSGDAKNKKAKGDTVVGIAAGAFSLLADAVTSNYQERSLKQLNRSVSEMLLCTNVIATVSMGCIFLLSGELGPASAYVHEHPNVVYQLLFSATLGYLGLVIWTATIKTFGAVIATGAGIFRKFFNVVFSFLLFPKPFLVQHAMGMTLFFMGLVISWWQQKQRSMQQKAAYEASSEDIEAGDHRKIHRPDAIKAGGLGSDRYGFLRLYSGSRKNFDRNRARLLDL